MYKKGDYIYPGFFLKEDFDFTGRAHLTCGISLLPEAVLDRGYMIALWNHLWYNDKKKKAGSI